MQARTGKLTCFLLLLCSPQNPKPPRPCNQGQGVPAIKGVRQEVGAGLVGRGGAVCGQHDMRAGDAQLRVLRLQRDDAQRGGVGLRTPFSGCDSGLGSGHACLRGVGLRSPFDRQEAPVVQPAVQLVRHSCCRTRCADTRDGTCGASTRSVHTVAVAALPARQP